MNFIEKIKLLLQMNGLWKKIREEYMTNGMKSSEFWVTVLSSLLTVAQTLQGHIDAKTGTIIVAVLTAAYNIARGLAKQGTDGVAPAA